MVKRERASVLKAKKEMATKKEDKIKIEYELYGTREPSMDKIVERIYIGNYASALEKEYLKNNNIKYILIAADDMLCPWAEELDIKFIRLPIKDSQTEDITQFFGQAFEFIDKILTEDNGNLLIQCGVGGSRSVAILIGYLIQRFGLSFSKSYALIRKHRKVAKPNKGFIQQLINFSKEKVKAV